MHQLYVYQLSSNGQFEQTDEKGWIGLSIDSLYLAYLPFIVQDLEHSALDLVVFVDISCFVATRCALPAICTCRYVGGFFAARIFPSI